MWTLPKRIVLQKKEVKNQGKGIGDIEDPEKNWKAMEEDVVYGHDSWEGNIKSTKKSSGLRNWAI